MAAKFFGQYLIDQGVISGFDLVRVLKFQEKNNLPFGTLVIQMDFMTSAQVASVYESQKLKDMPFGDMAVEMGLLTAGEVNMILKVQKKKHIHLGQALLALGVLEQKELDQHLGDFDRQQKEVNPTEISIPAHVPDHPVLKLIVEISGKMLQRLTDLPFHLGSGGCYNDQKLDHQVTIKSKLSGAINVHLTFGFSNKTRILLSTSLLNNEHIHPPAIEIQNKALIDFLELTTTNIVNKALQNDYLLKASPPQLFDNEKIDDAVISETDLFYPIYLPDGGVIDLMILS
jgi:hypothetical protein